MGSLALALALGLGPQSAGRWALWAVGGSALHRDRGDRHTHGERLGSISWRESRWCADAGVHVRDAYLSRKSWRGQVRLGHLDAECQPYGPDGRWSTRGVHGLNAAVHWRYLPACYQPEVLDIVLVSAIVAARKFKRRCEDAPREGWCRYQTPTDDHC